MTSCWSRAAETAHKKGVKPTPNIELLVEAIRARILARIDTLKSDPEPDDATLRDLEIHGELLERLEVRPPLGAWSTGPTLH